MNLEELSLDASTFNKNRQRPAGEDVDLRFFDAMVRQARDLDAGGDRNFEGEKRRNDTHTSTTDPEAKLLRKALGKETKPCFMATLRQDGCLRY
jgi:hypothetical protein